MNTQINMQLKCQMCSQPLSKADDICLSCEKTIEKHEISFQKNTPEKKNIKGGICPACNAKSLHFHSVLFPEKSAWYRYQEEVPVCPVCKIILRRKYVVNRWYFAIFWIVHTALPMFPITTNLIFLLRMLCTAFALSYATILLYRSYRDPVKYEARI